MVRKVQPILIYVQSASVLPLYIFFEIDENECLQNRCHVNATCENRDGSFKCFCKIGFTGNGESCNGNRPKEDGKITHSKEQKWTNRTEIHNKT